MLYLCLPFVFEHRRRVELSVFIFLLDLVIIEQFLLLVELLLFLISEAIIKAAKRLFGFLFEFDLLLLDLQLHLKLLLFLFIR